MEPVLKRWDRFLLVKRPIASPYKGRNHFETEILRSYGCRCRDVAEPRQPLLFRVQRKPFLIFPSAALPTLADKTCRSS